MSEKGRGWNLKAGEKDGDKGRRLGARAGWEGLVAAKGLRKAHVKLRDWRLSHPSDLERIVMDRLDELNVAYEREVYLTDGSVHGYADFVVGSVVIEVDSDAFHGGDLSPERDYDGIKARLCSLAGLRLVRLPERAVRNGKLEETLRKELGL